MEIHASAQVQSVFLCAEKVAKQLHHSTIGTEHLLIALVKTPEIRLSHLLKKRGLSEKKLMDDMLPLSDLNIKEEAFMTKKLKDIYEQAYRIAYANHHQEVSADDLSFALLQSEDNVALELLRQAGINIQQVTNELNQSNLFH